MPVKPEPWIIEAANKTVDPKEVVLTVINETPELRQAALDAHIVREVMPASELGKEGE